MANNFEYFAPTKVVFGRGAEEQVGRLVKEAGGSKVLIHYGGKSAVRSGLIDRLKGALDEAGIPHVELGGVVPNPLLSKVYEGIELCRAEGVDFILAVGGGSSIDSSKAIAYGLANEGDVWDLYEHTKTAAACKPVGVVLTIAAAGSETSNGSVITNEKNGEKRAYDDDLARPKFAVMNPEFTMTLPDYQTESGCTDMMMHTMERYFTNGGNMEITDSIAEGLLRTIKENAVILHHDPENYEARAEVMWAGSLAHNGLTGCGNDGGDFSSHMLEHEMGGMFNVTHGAGLAAIWGSWARYVYRNCLHRFVRYAVNVMGVEHTGNDEETALKGIEAMEVFYHSIGMPTNMRELGIHPTEEQIHEMAVRCAAACGGSQGSARVLYQEDMEKIYRMAV
ncbi:MAG: iron-containing alcohol dehydrogenase [Eubacteriales bacterium]|nr:iron-containing alcohol dehydrogenase [Eubacteriales bacterium]